MTWFTYHIRNTEQTSDFFTYICIDSWLEICDKEWLADEVVNYSYIIWTAVLKSWTSVTVKCKCYMHHYTESFTCGKNISQARNGEVAVAVHSVGPNTESWCVLIMKNLGGKIGVDSCSLIILLYLNYQCYWC